MDAILTNRLFHLTKNIDDRELKNNIIEVTNGKIQNMIKKRPNGDIEIDVPR